VKKKMIYRFSTPLTHAMPFHHYYSSLSQIIQGQNLTKSCIHTEKLTLGGTLIFHILFEGKEETPEIDNS
jgi:hypothetical protein